MPRHIYNFCIKYQDEVGGGFEKQQSLSGEISMLNMWDRLLTDLEVSRMAKCYGIYKSVYNESI